MYIFPLAWRYATCRLVNLVAVLAVALALTVQIVVMAVLDGMLLDMEQRVRELGEQITISFQGELPGREDFARAASACAALPGVKGATPLIRQYALARREPEYALTLVYGIDLAAETAFSRLPQHLVDLKLDPRTADWFGGQPHPSNRPPLYLSARVAEQLTAKPGDEVELVFYKNGAKDEPARRTFRLASTFRSGSPYMDEMGAYIPLEDAQAMFLSDARPVVERFSIWLDDPARAGELEQPVAQAVLNALGPNSKRQAYSSTWLTRWRDLYEGMAHENMLQEIVLVLMNLSGGFCVFAILATLVSRRGRDVGLLRCLGARRRTVAAVFLLVGLLIGLAGTVLGVAGGYYSAPRIDRWYELLTGQPLYPPRMFGITSLTIAIYPAKVALYALGAVVISVGAALYPALWAAARQPVEALRDE